MKEDLVDITNRVYEEPEPKDLWYWVDQVFDVLWNFFAAIGMTTFVLLVVGYFMEKMK